MVCLSWDVEWLISNRDNGKFGFVIWSAAYIGKGIKGSDYISK